MRDIMGMPVAVEIVGASDDAAQEIFKYFRSVDDTFSTYKEGSEISRINRGELTPSEYSNDVEEVLRLSEETKQLTGGFFDITTPHGTLDPSGLVKGWAINNAAKLLRSRGHENFYIEIGGDIATSGVNEKGEEWCIGIRNPSKREEIVKVVVPRGKGVVTSGTAARGSHIWDPHTGKEVETDVLSLTVIGPNVYEADRFATAAFAMGLVGISFIESLEGFEGYQITADGLASMTSHFSDYV